jgi:hypothetical protein
MDKESNKKARAVCHTGEKNRIGRFDNVVPQYFYSIGIGFCNEQEKGIAPILLSRESWNDKPNDWMCNSRGTENKKSSFEYGHFFP